MSGSAKYRRRLTRAVEEQGGTVKLTGSGHLRIEVPGGVIFAPATPSDYRGLRNLVSKARRVGLDLREAIR